MHACTHFAHTHAHRIYWKLMVSCARLNDLHEYMYNPVYVLKLHQNTNGYMKTELLKTRRCVLRRIFRYASCVPFSRYLPTCCQAPPCNNVVVCCACRPQVFGKHACVNNTRKIHILKCDCDLTVGHVYAPHLATSTLELEQRCTGRSW